MYMVVDGLGRRTRNPLMPVELESHQWQDNIKLASYTCSVLVSIV